MQGLPVLEDTDVKAGVKPSGPLLAAVSGHDMRVIVTSCHVLLLQAAE